MGPAMKPCRPFSLFVLSVVTVTGLTSCDRRSADQSAVSVAQANETVQRQPGARWVVDPADPGPDMPPVGRSLFDYVVAEQQGRRTVYQVPFPFTALVRKIEQELGPDDRGLAAQAGVDPVEPISSETCRQARVFRLSQSRHRGG